MSWSTPPEYYNSLKIVYEGSVPSRIRSSDKTERTDTVDIRMSTGRSKEGRGVQVLVIQLSNMNDLYFLHTLEVSEDDFQQLKIDQGILVDFQQFPTKLIELFQLCNESAGSDPIRFQSELRVVSSQDSRLSVVETNNFKQITHIALGFKPGSDAAVKQYLASRLIESRGDAAQLRSDLASTSDSLNKTVRAESSLTSELSSQRDMFERERMTWEATASQKMADVKNAHVQELMALRKQLEDDKMANERRLETHSSDLQSQIRDLDTQRSKLLDQKLRLDAQVSELSSKLGSAEGQLRAAQQESDRVSKQHRELVSQHMELEKNHNAALVKLASGSQEAKAHSEQVSTLKRMLTDVEKAKAATEETLAELRLAKKGSDERMRNAEAEVEKGNQIIDRLQADLKAARAKLKLKAAVIAQQEHAIVEHQGRLEKTTREALHLKNALEREQHNNEVLTARVEDQKTKLDESRELLTSNQQMIQWLNAQITEAQLGRHTSGSARYSSAFRSSASLPIPAGRDSAATAGVGTGTATAAASTLAQKYARAAEMPLPTRGGGSAGAGALGVGAGR